jgi:hypothetical protein
MADLLSVAVRHIVQGADLGDGSNGHKGRELRLWIARVCYKLFGDWPCGAAKDGEPSYPNSKTVS